MKQRSRFVLAKYYTSFLFVTLMIYWSRRFTQPNSPTNNITELNELIYAGAKLACDKTGVFQSNPNQNRKPEWEIRLEGLAKKLQEEKMRRKKKNKGISWDRKPKQNRKQV